MRRTAQLLILVLLAIFLVPILLPKTIETTVERSLSIEAASIYEDFNNLNKLSKWEAWTQQDSTAKREFYSPYRGVGAGYKWEYEGESGELTIKKVKVNEWIEYAVEGFSLGKNGNMKVEFSPIDSIQTNVKWTFSSEPVNYFSRYFTYFSEKKLTEKMNQSLDNLTYNRENTQSTLVQNDDALSDEVRLEQFEGMKLIAVQNKTSLEAAEFETAKEESFGLIYSYLVDYIKLDANEIGHPITFVESTDSSAKQMTFYCGYPIKKSIPLDEEMELVYLEAGDALVCIHKGSEKTIPTSLAKMKKYAQMNQYVLGSNYWLEYLNETQTQGNPDNLWTKIYLPIKTKAAK